MREGTMSYKPNVRTFALIALLASIPFPAQAQQPAPGKNPLLFKELKEGDLSPAQAKDLNAIRSRPTNVDTKVITIDVEALKNASQVSAMLPQSTALKDIMLGAKTSEFASTIQNLNGKLVMASPQANVSDTFKREALADTADRKSVFTVEGKKVYGTILTPDGTYSIRPLADGTTHAISKIDFSKFPPAEPPKAPTTGLQDLPPDSGSLNDLQLRKPTDTKVYNISVLVGYTPAAKAGSGNPEQLAKHAIDLTNRTYRDAGIRANLVLAATTPVALTESGDYSKDLAAVRSMATLKQARKLAKANLVIVMIDSPQYCGLASQIYASSPNAYAVVWYSCAADNMSLAHELGHLQGARHDIDNDNSLTPFPYGHGFADGTRHVRDIMGYDCPAGCNRLPRWSAPPDLGTAERSNVVRVLDTTAPYISSLQ